MKRYKAKKIAETLIETGSAHAAYKKLHPDAKASTAKSNSYKLLRQKEVLAELELLLASIKPVEVTKDSIVKLISQVITGWLNGDERIKTSDYNKSIELLSNLVPEFANKLAISEFDKMKESDLEREIARLQEGEVPKSDA